MTRFFVAPHQISQGLATLDEGDAHHLRVVLKAQPGERVSILDGSGREWPGALLELGKSRALVKLGSPARPGTEPRTQVTVAQALPKVADKMEQVLQHGTEVGAAAFWAYQSARSLTHLTGERHDKRLMRWQAIVKTAAEQAHRARLPLVRADGTLGDVLRAVPAFDLALLAHTASAPALRTALSSSLLSVSSPLSVLIVVGPESGFADAEGDEARQMGVQWVSLGPRILRTETAALVMLSQILYTLESS